MPLRCRHEHLVFAVHQVLGGRAPGEGGLSYPLQPLSRYLMLPLLPPPLSQRIGFVPKDVFYPLGPFSKRLIRPGRRSELGDGGMEGGGRREGEKGGGKCGAVR